MKKWLMKISCLILCFLSLGISACNNSPDLYQKGIEITTIMGEMVNSETYVEMIVGGGHCNLDLVKAKDYDTPTRAYKISIPAFDLFVQNMKSVDETKFNELPDNLKEQIENKYSFLTIVSFLNSYYGSSESLLLWSSLFASKTFDGKISSSIAYLYTFETGRPIIVLFEPFGGERFKANGQFVFAEDLSSLSKVREVFERFGCTVENAN